MYTLRQYLTALSASRGLTRTLGEVEVCRDAQGGMCYSAGNSAVVFRIRHRGAMHALRCYTRPMRRLSELYGDQLLERELFVHTTPDTGEWVDVVLGDWIEGVTLSEAVAEAALGRDILRLKSLARAFDSLAASLVADDWAHGDLKPDNIIVSPDGSLHLIDFDARFLPAFAGEQSPELGTAAYQHPARTQADFDASLDDFPAALISTNLHALALNPELYDGKRASEGLVFTAQDVPSAGIYRDLLDLFERGGHAAAYRIARLLHSPGLRLFGLGELLGWLTDDKSLETRTPELYVENGLWGYCTPTHRVTPPLYDEGFDFTEGLAAVRLGRTWHYIDPTGRTQLSVPGCEAVKPFRNGRAVIVRDGVKQAIDIQGCEFAI